MPTFTPGRRARSRRRWLAIAAALLVAAATPAVAIALDGSPAATPAATSTTASNPLLALLKLKVGGSAGLQLSAGPLCGMTLKAKPGGGFWTCSFDDEFNGTSLDPDKWVAQTSAGSNTYAGESCFVDDPDNVAVSGGNLHLVVRQEAAPFFCDGPDFTTQYTAASVMTFQRFSQTYGRFEIRAKLPAAKVRGLQESFWLWPDNPLKYGPWPYSGEIDIAEMYHILPDRAIPFIHYVPSFVDTNVTNNYCMISNLAAYHTYAVEWTPSSIKVIYDGKTCLVDNWNPAAPLVKPQPFDHPFMVAMTAGLGIGGNSFVPGLTPLPAETQVDYVRVWK